ncbi:MAG: hypothetical protein D4S01_07195 [Dehalococcoidia bacterium]|nr:MAG: hypothetical protein D4S01_07195 [Dehalococcoidia bacterium]
MKKTISITLVLLLLPSLLALSAPQLIGVRTVNASETCMIWGSKCEQTSEEILAAADACSYTLSKFSSYMSYNWILNAYGGTTTKANVESCTSSCDNSYDASVVFYTGHGWNLNDIDGTYHYHVYSNTSFHWADGIQDLSIQEITDGETHYFVFIWACFQGNERGYDHETGAVGMPYAWTQQDENDLNIDGYHNDDDTLYCFIGFNNTSPPLHEEAEGGPYGYEYGNFVKYFYYFLTYHHETINEALDDAADWVFDSDFDDSALWEGFEWEHPEHGTQNGTMVVYGNGDNTLPYDT